MMHAKLTSIGLINSLSFIGLFASYDETLKFEASILNDINEHKYPNAYVQFVLDNADHNTITIDGKNTFHAMDRIESVNPASAVTFFGETIERLKKLPSAKDIAQSRYFALGMKIQMQD